MQFSAQTRLKIDDNALQALSALGELHGRLKHQLYQQMARTGGNAKSHKTGFSLHNGITARFFNALAVEVQGAVDSTCELLKDEAKELANKVVRLKQKVSRLGAELDRGKPGYKGKQARLLGKRLRRVRQALFDSQCMQRRREQRLLALKARLASNVPGIAFGSRELFKRQWTMAHEQAHADWREEWQGARSHQIFYLGSKDETGGNQSCTANLEEDGSFTLRIRHPLKDGEFADGSKYLTIAGVKFAYGDAALKAAGARGQALSWRFHRDVRGWRAFVSFEAPAHTLVTCNEVYGCLGVDFNEDHLAVCEVNAHGNAIGFEELAFGSIDEISAGHREACLSDSLTLLVERAAAARLPIAAEAMDFQGLKRRVAAEHNSPKRRRKLSGLLYARFLALLARKCEAAGVKLILVDPAHTSVIGRIKYADAMGVSVHRAAAMVIARRAQHCNEKPPRAGHVVMSGLALSQPFLVPARKAKTTERSAWGDLSQQYSKHRLAAYRQVRQAQEKGPGIARSLKGSSLTRSARSTGWSVRAS